VSKNLRLDIDGDAGRADAALAETAAAVAYLAKEANRLGDEFQKAARDSVELDAALAATKAQVSSLAREMATATDDGVKKQLQSQLDVQRQRAGELQKLRTEIIGDTERDANRASSAWAKAADGLARDTSRLAAEADKASASAAKNAEKAAAKARKEFEDLVKDVTQSAPSLGQAFSSPLSALASPAGIAIGGPTAVVGGAALGGLATAGVGAGVAGAGVAGAALGDPDEFARRWGAVTAQIKAQFIDATRVFDGPGLQAIDSLGATFKGLDLKGLFAAAVPYLKPLVAGAESMSKYIFQGIENLTKDAGPAVATLSKDLPMIGKSIGDALTNIGSEAQGGADGLHALDLAISDTIAGIGYFVAGAEAVTGAVQDASSSTKSFFDSIPGWVSIAIPPLALYKELFDATVGSEADGGAVFGQAMQGVQTGADGAIGKMDDLGVVGGTTFITLDQQARDLTAQLGRMNEEFDKAISNALGLSNANIGAAQALDDLAKGFKKGSDALDITTQKGRDNETLINDSIAAYQRQRDAAIASGDGTKASYENANAAYQTAIDGLQNTLVKLGLSKSAAKQFLDAFHDVTFTITERVKVVQTGSVSGQGVISGGVPHLAGSAYASGTMNSRAGWALVGENGPEIVRLPAGSQVYNSAQSRSALSGYGSSTGNSGGGGYAVSYLGPTTGLDGIFATWLAEGTRNGLFRIHSVAII
jgi:hypothetical protein